MRKSFTAAVAIIGACALIGSLLTNALASKPAPLRGLARTQDKKFAVNGSLNVTGVLKVNKNVNIVTGKLYAHNGAQIWKRLTISGGGLIVTPALQVTGPSAATFAGGLTTSGNVTTGALTVNGALSTTGAASIGGKLTSIGGVDAGAGGVTTTGDVAAKNVNASGNITTTGNISANQLTVQTLSITNFAPSTISTGAISAATLTTTGNASIGGTLSAGSTTLGGLALTSGANVNFNGANVNFTGANVTGLSGVGTGGNPSSLIVGASTATTSPLTITENNHSATIGVDTNGNLTVSPGFTTVTTSSLTSSLTSSNTLNALSIAGAPINLQNATNLVNGSDLGFSIPGANVASHILANGDADVAGVTSAITVQQNTNPPQTYSTTLKTFSKPYASTPIVVVTPTTNPGLYTTGAVHIWVTASTTGFTVNLATTGNVTQQYSVSFNYLVIGG